MTVSRVSREAGFTLIELLVSSTILLLVIGATLTTFQNAQTVNDSGAQLADANQNLRAGTNQLIRDLMTAGRIIGPGGVPLPTGAGVGAFSRPGPPGTALTFTATLVSDTDTSLNLPDIITGFQLGPNIIGSTTDVVTMLTMDEFMPVIQTPPAIPATPTSLEGTIAADGSSATLPLTSLWLVGDPILDTAPIQVGDLIWFKSANGTAVQTITSIDTTHIYFAPGDYFNFNQRNVAYNGTVLNLKPVVNTTTAFPTTQMFRMLMITYYVDNVTTPGTPRLTRAINHPVGVRVPEPFAPQALAGVVEDLDLTYDLVDGVTNPANITSLPYTDPLTLVTYTSNQIRKVNLHVGVRSQLVSKPIQDYVRNHMSTAVDVRSLASVGRYPTTLTQ
jgi:prepilin-type N-terminal cleavage/methylation domain-containing protein